MTTEIDIPVTLNLGCSQCGDQSVKAIVLMDEYTMEVIETVCEKHQEVAA